MSNLPAPRYSIWQAMSVCLAIAQRAIEEVRALAREPGPEGRQGERGEKGRDGAGFDNLEQFEDGVYYGINFRSGDQVKELRWVKPTLADAYIRVWKEGTYRRGTVATWDGSLFITLSNTSTKPGVAGSDWVLAVKRGRDGNDAYDIARRAGFKGNEKEWLESLKGDPGKPGKSGKNWDGSIP